MSKYYLEEFHDSHHKPLFFTILKSDPLSPPEIK